MWISDDATGCGSIPALREWWNKSVATGPQNGYYPNAVKTKLLVEASKLQLAESIFVDTDIDITADGTRILGSVAGNESFITQYVSKQVSEWCKEQRTLLKIAETEPQASLSCLTRGLYSKYPVLARTTPCIDHLLAPLQERLDIFPSALLGRSVDGELLEVLANAMPRRWSPNTGFINMLQTVPRLPGHMWTSD